MLPHKAHQKDYNQLIGYLAELTEVVEKQATLITNLRGGWTDAEIAQASFKSTPTLKETLMEAISNEKRAMYPVGSYLNHRNGYNEAYNNAIDSVEAIINRLMP